MKNKGGQTVMLSIMFAVVIFIFGALLLNFLPDLVTSARDGLSCSSSTISDGTKLTCLLVDGVVPYYILLLISLVGGILLSRFIL